MTTIDRASSFAGQLDGLVILILVLAGFWFLVAEGVFFWLLFAGRAKPGRKAQYLTGSEKHVKRWINYPHILILVCDVFIVAGSIIVWHNVKQELPEHDSVVGIVGQQWAWTFRHPGADREIDTEDDIVTVDELHLEVGRTYHYRLEATDVLHSFSVPVFRLKQDAVPGRMITGWFQPTQTGEFDVQCAEICGFGHSLMAARVFVRTPEEHAAWISQNSPTQ